MNPELISFLQKNPDAEILLASDSEGNSFSSLGEVCHGYVFDDYSGGTTDEVFELEDLVDASDPDESVLNRFKRVVVIYPA